MRVASWIVAVSISAASMACEPPRPVPPPSHPTETVECARRPFDDVAISRYLGPNVVRISAEGILGRSSGTGFVIAADRQDRLLVVTNRHVVESGETISAFVVTPSRETVQITGLELCKDSHKDDLALLCAPRLPGSPPGLRLSDSPPELGQKIATLGYPKGAGSTTTASFEAGAISVLARQVGDRTFMQTNANINPGNSGGPAVDACGEVVGVTTAVLTDAQRMALIVPVDRVKALRDRYLAPRQAASVAISARLAGLERAIMLQSATEATELFSHRFLREIIGPQFLRFLDQSKAAEKRVIAVLEDKGIRYDSLTFEQRDALLREILPPLRYHAMRLTTEMALGRLDIYEAFQQYIGISSTLSDIFGALRTMKVLGIHEKSDSEAVARVEIINESGSHMWDFDIVDEHGDWHILQLNCLSNCSH